MPGKTFYDIYRRKVSNFRAYCTAYTRNFRAYSAILRIYLDFLTISGYNRLYQLKEEFMKLKKASSILTRIIISAVLMFLLFYSIFAGH